MTLALSYPVWVMQVIDNLVQANPLFVYLFIFGVALFVSLILTPLAQNLSWRWGTVAVPGGRRQHEGKVPTLGGIPLLGALLVATACIYWLLPSPNPHDARLLRGILWGSSVVFMGALLDDRWELPPLTLYLIQFLGSIVAIGHTVFIERFTNPFTGEEVVIEAGWLIFVLTLFWLTGMINTVNFLDGLDGLAAGVGTVAALIFAWHSYRLEQEFVAAFPLALAGALLGFLRYNFSPARIFLGSAGAYLLGYQIATLAIISPAKIATALLVMAVPILDVAWRIVDRLRNGRNPFSGDRGHLHFLLFDSGLPTRWIVLGYYAVSTAFGLVAIFAESAQLKLGMLLGLATAVSVLLLWLIRHRQPTP